MGSLWPCQGTLRTARDGWRVVPGLGRLGGPRSPPRVEGLALRTPGGELIGLGSGPHERVVRVAGCALVETWESRSPS